MEHSDKYEKVLSYYRLGMWNKERVKNAVVKSWITAAEYKEITGDDYVA